MHLLFPEPETSKHLYSAIIVIIIITTILILLGIASAGLTTTSGGNALQLAHCSSQNGPQLIQLGRPNIIHLQIVDVHFSQALAHLTATNFQNVSNKRANPVAFRHIVRCPAYDQTRLRLAPTVPKEHWLFPASSRVDYPTSPHTLPLQPARTPERRLAAKQELRFAPFAGASALTPAKVATLPCVAAPAPEFRPGYVSPGLSVTAPNLDEPKARHTRPRKNTHTLHPGSKHHFSRCQGCLQMRRQRHCCFMHSQIQDILSLSSYSPHLSTAIFPIILSTQRTSSARPASAYRLAETDEYCTARKIGNTLCEAL